MAPVTLVVSRYQQNVEYFFMIHDETAAQNSGGAPGFARLACVAHPPLVRSFLPSCDYFPISVLLTSGATNGGGAGVN